MGSPGGTGFGYELRGEDGHTVVSVHGELDMAGAPDLAACLHHLCASGVMHVTVDLAGLTFCDSSGLETFLQCRTEAERQGAGLELRSPQPIVRRLFELTNTDELLSDRA